MMYRRLVELIRAHPETMTYRQLARQQRRLRIRLGVLCGVALLLKLALLWLIWW